MRPPDRPETRFRRAGTVAGVLTAVLVAAACTRDADPPERPSLPRVSPSESPASSAGSGDFVLASSFEQPVCGVWWRPDPGCEFGVEGEVVSGAFSCRTGETCLRFQRMNEEIHVAVLAPAPAPDGRAFIGVAHRIPEFPDGAISDRLGYLELVQMTPTDGTLQGWPVEVRIYPDRRLGLGLAQVDVRAGQEVVLTEFRAPVDRWFYVVVEISNGDPATQRMWVYGPDDRLAEKVSVDLTTSIEWVHGTRAVQKVGGNVSTEVPLFTFADDWYVATEFEGPLHIGADGAPIGG